jgi:hypothetical protein
MINGKAKKNKRDTDLKPYFENNPLDLALIKLDSCLKGFDKGWNDFSEVNS